jgi:peptidoglycan L-alanyl-D-glutamate endopeptidase CwlK
MPKLGNRSKKKRDTCHHKLKLILDEAIKRYDFTVLCGHRNEEEQEKAFLDGYSKAKFGQSPHNYQPSKAVDIAPWVGGHIPWNNREEFYVMATVILSVANKLGIKIKWGGHFKSFFDGPHFELDPREI